MRSQIAIYLLCNLAYMFVWESRGIVAIHPYSNRKRISFDRCQIACAAAIPRAVYDSNCASDSGDHSLEFRLVNADHCFRFQ